MPDDEPVMHFLLDGIGLDIPIACLSPPLKEALQSGRYEHSEAAALAHHLRPEDRVLDLGGGAGFLAIQAARIVGASHVHVVEANPDMQHALRTNLDQNGAEDCRLTFGAVVPDDYADENVRFHARKAFWAAAIAAPDRQDHPLVVDVPAIKIGELLSAVRPTFLILDVEGAELALSQHQWPDSLRMVVMEIHSGQYGAAGIHQVFEGFARAGLTYMPWGSRGETIVLQRVTATG